MDSEIRNWNKTVEGNRNIIRMDLIRFEIRFLLRIFVKKLIVIVVLIIFINPTFFSSLLKIRTAIMARKLTTVSSGV